MQLDERTIIYAGAGLGIMLGLTLRFRRERKVRRLRLEWLWVVPVLYGALFGWWQWQYPPSTPHGWLWLVVAMAAGAAVGWWRGSHMRIVIDPDTHQLNQQATPTAFLLLLLLVVARYGLRYEARAYDLDIYDLTGLLMATALGLFAATRAEMFLRARRLLAAARAG